MGFTKTVHPNLLAKGADGFAELAPAAGARTLPKSCDIVENEIKKTLPLKECRESAGVDLSRSGLKFEGVYISSKDKHFLRFYPNGKVIGATTSGSASDVKPWLKIESEMLGCGLVSINGNTISISTHSTYGTVNYEGVIREDGSLELSSHSLINGYKSGKRIYEFNGW